MMMLERPAIIQNELERAEQLAPYECKHGLGCFCEKCAFKKRVAKTLDSMRKKRKENQGDFPPEKGIENTDESPGLNAIGKPYSESYDPKYQVRHRPPSIGRLYAPLKPAPPSTFTSQTSALKSAWVNASPEAKRHFLVEYWDEILREKSAADDDRTEHTTEDASLVAVESAV